MRVRNRMMDCEPCRHGVRMRSATRISFFWSQWTGSSSGRFETERRVPGRVFGWLQTLTVRVYYWSEGARIVFSVAVDERSLCMCTGPHRWHQLDRRRRLHAAGAWWGEVALGLRAIRRKKKMGVGTRCGGGTPAAVRVLFCLGPHARGHLDRDPAEKCRSSRPRVCSVL
jgi:hypothetical protein